MIDMNCDDIQQSLSLYVDDGLTAEARQACYQHLEVCPVCREHVVELRKKLEAGGTRLIHTLRNRGYFFGADPG